MVLKPMFPLKLVVFPGEKLNLHIFEPRYIQLITDCADSKGTFFIPPVIDDKVMPMATEMILQRVEKTYDDGKMDIRTLGKQVWTVHDFERAIPGKLYGGGRVEQVIDELQGDLSKNLTILRLVRKLHKLMQITTSLPDKASQGLCYKIGHQVGLNIQQEFKLLELRDEVRRQDYLINHLENLIPLVREMNAMRDKVQQNGHFRNIIPPDI